MPTDEITGLPHPIYIEDDAYASLGYPDVTYHHHFYYRRDPDLEGPEHIPGELLTHPEDIPIHRIAGLAVRMSRGQRLPAELHTQIHKEDKFPQGPELPHTLDQKFETAVKASTGVVSRLAIDVANTTPGDIRYVYLNDEAYARVADSRLLCTERAYLPRGADPRRRVLGNFFMRYAVRQDLSHVSPSKIDEFLHTHDEDIRRSIGHELLREAMEVGIATVTPKYQELKLQGMVQPGRPELRKSVWKFVHPERRQAVFRVLRKNLLAA